MITCVKMEESHVAQIAALERRCFSAPWSERSIASELENPLASWFVALEGERVLGYVGAQSVQGEADMMNLAVLPEFRRQGIAKALLAALEEHLREHGVNALTLEVRASNAPALALYEKWGFQQVGRRKGYYEKPKEDALILKKEWTV